MRDDALGPGQRFAVTAIEICSRILARKVAIRWAPAHSRAAGNEVANRHAKSAATGEDPVEEVPEGYAAETSLLHMTRGEISGDGGVNLGARQARATMQPPPGMRPPTTPTLQGEENPRRPLLPAPFWACSDRDLPAAVWGDGHERVLVVR